MARKVGRFANEKIADLVKYIQTPHVERSRQTVEDPYFYGMSGRQWREDQNAMHKAIQTGSMSRARAEDILYHRGLSDTEADMMIDWSKNRNNDVSRHVQWGVPQATTSEVIMNKVLNASGINTKLANQDDPTATDLSRMVGNVKQYIDVQNRNSYFNRRTGEEMGTLMPILKTPPGVAGQVFNKASNSDSMLTIGNQIMRESPNWAPGKMFENEIAVSRGLIPPDHRKDLIIGGHIHPRKFPVHGLRAGHGPYNPMLPNNIIVQDQSKLRDNLFGMSKGEYLKRGGMVLDDDYRRSLDLSLPTKLIEEMSKPDNEYISKEVMEALNYLQAG